MSLVKPVKRALISVSDKTDIVPFAQQLEQLDIELLSTGGTAKLLAEHNVNVTEVSEYTEYPEMMDGRVKTLHPKIHGALLGRRGIDDATMAQHDMIGIDLLVVNLYPFEETIQKNDDLATAIEQIDIGGPTMLRAAAKNHNDVIVIVSPADYDHVIHELKQSSGTQKDFRFNLAAKAFAHTAKYDAAISNYFNARLDNLNEPSKFPDVFSFQYKKIQDMRYGENPHQKAAFYSDTQFSNACVAQAHQIQGKALSFNNIADTDAALECVKSFSVPACVIVKHANPCGVAIGKNIFDAYQKAYQTDPTSAFGGIIAFNRELDAETAQHIIQRQFVEVMIAPKVSEKTIAVLKEKENIRLLESGEWRQTHPTLDYKKVTGGLLIQDTDNDIQEYEPSIKIVTQRTPTEEEMKDLLFSWKVTKFVKSNAIVYAKDQQTIGIGAGQMSRVYSAKIAALKAHDEGLIVKGSVMASDAFFPFRDTIDAAAKEGITAIIQPGGSIRDSEVIDAANEHGIAMIFTDMRHFKH